MSLIIKIPSVMGTVLGFIIALLLVFVFSLWDERLLEIIPYLFFFGFPLILIGWVISLYLFKVFGYKEKNVLIIDIVFGVIESLIVIFVLSISPVTRYVDIPVPYAQVAWAIQVVVMVLGWRLVSLFFWKKSMVSPVRPIKDTEIETKRHNHN